MKILGIIFVIAGLLAFIYGGITYTRKEEIIDFGPIEATTTERRTIPISPIVGGIAVLAGLVMIASGGRRLTT